MKKLLLILSLVLLGACRPNPDRVREVLDAEGFTEVRLQGYGGSCGRDYSSSEDFSALNPHGRRVHGTVCCGAWVGCSIHW